MIRHTRIPQHHLILSLSKALDYLCPEIADHQQRVTYIAFHMAREMGFSPKDLNDLFLAAALHDIGLIRWENRIRFLRDGDLDSVAWHGETGFELLKDSQLLAKAAWIIRLHHMDWNNGQGAAWEEREVPLASHVIHVADQVEQAIRRDTPVLMQSSQIMDRIFHGTNQEFHPGCVKALQALSQKPSFWLDCVSGHITDLLLEEVEERNLDATEAVLMDIVEIFARVVDAMSEWTATHTSGVAASAVALSEKMGFSPREQALMRTAGLLHDLGKITVPTSILNKPGKFTTEEWAVIKGHPYHTFRILDGIGFPWQITEWAAFHHERMDGKGYPFLHHGDELTLGSRIMTAADVFTALSEDRPYREGLERAESVSALRHMVQRGALDGTVVDVLVEHYDHIEAVRWREQARYAEMQERLYGILSEDDVLQAARW